ncbi:MAG: hypothetical protein NTW03_08195 [Verrucomicrobia bacterium]|nr:hypothetical protein [Verrucomicrobiota bacterium]
MTQTSVLSASMAVALLLSPATTRLSAASWPQWRGPQRNGISQETGLLKEWPKDGPKQVWTVTNLGMGYASPAVVGDRLYLLANEGIENEFVQALAVKDGHRIWLTRLGKVGNPNQQPKLPAARSTPTGKRAPEKCAGRRIFAPISAASPALGPTRNHP